MMHWNGSFSASRLKLLRVVAEETQEKMARSLNISRSCLANYETGRRIPDAELVSDFAEHFHVNALYFLGNTFMESIHDVSDAEQELIKLMPKNGLLDLTDISAEGRVALLQFYSFLLEKKKEQKEAEA